MLTWDFGVDLLSLLMHSNEDWVPHLYPKASQCMELRDNIFRRGTAYTEKTNISQFLNNFLLGRMMVMVETEPLCKVTSSKYMKKPW